jgi:hypothetical protein
MVLDTAPILTDEGAQPGKVDIAVVGQVALEARGDSELIPAIGEASREASKNTACMNTKKNIIKSCPAVKTGIA